MLAGAVALAAGRFQPLIGLQVSASGPQKEGEPARHWRFGDVLSIAQASELARGSRRGSPRFSIATTSSATSAISLPSPAIGLTHIRLKHRNECSEGVMRSTI